MGQVSSEAWVYTGADGAAGACEAVAKAFRSEEVDRCLTESFAESFAEVGVNQVGEVDLSELSFTRSLRPGRSQGVAALGRT